MPRTCTICTHPERQAIDRSLLAGEAFRHIAGRSGTSTGSLQRHKAEHIPVALAKAREVGEVALADSLLDQMRDLQRHSLRIAEAAEHAGDLRTALAAIGQSREILGLLAKVAPEALPAGPAITQLIVMPQPPEGTPVPDMRRPPEDLGPPSTEMVRIKE